MSSLKLQSLLLVDDEPMIIELLRVMLRDHADQIYSASDGSEAVKFLETNQVECIVSDINMAPLDGLSFYNEINAKNLLPKLFLFFSAHLSRNEMGNFPPGVQMIAKPDFKLLIHEIQNFLKN